MERFKGDTGSRPNGFVKLVDEFRAWPIEQRADMHTHPIQSQIEW